MSETTTPKKGLYQWAPTDEKLSTFQGLNDAFEILDNAILDTAPTWVSLASTLQNGWVGGTYEPQYADMGNHLIFRGRIKSGVLGGGSYIPAFILPSQYRPLISHSFIVGGYSSNIWARIYALAYNSSAPGYVSVVTTASGSTVEEIDLGGLIVRYK